jgi:hypothetical protein
MHIQGIQATSLHLTLHNTTLSGLPPRIFDRMGMIYNISIDINSNNKKLNAIPNPNTAIYPNMPDKVLLTNLNMHYTTLSCDCDLGWIEFWQRKKRQYFCDDSWSDEPAFKSELLLEKNHCDDLFDDDDLRSARCSNKNGEPLLEILKSELECGWSSSDQPQVNYFVLVTFALLFPTFMI